MKRFSFKLLFFTPILLLIVSVNYFIDPARVYDDKYAIQVVNILLSGQSATNLYANFDERATKKKLAENFKLKNIDNLILGSSRVMLIGENVLPAQSNLNLGVSSARLEDIIAMYMICKKSGIKTKKVLIGIDPQFYNDKNKNYNWLTYSDNYFNFYDSTTHSYIHSLRYMFKNPKIINLLSISYFDISVKSMFRPGNQLPSATSEFNNINRTFHPDGSFSYDKLTRERNQTDINKIAHNWRFNEWADFHETSSKYSDLLNLFIKYVKKDDVEIVFLLLPWHPILYKSLTTEEQYRKLFETMEYITQLAQKNNIRTIGSFNPKECGCDETSFYDGGHLNSKGLKIIFNLN